MKSDISKSYQSVPIILGAGLVCLDIIKETDSIRFLNGGSCGNVVSALSLFGWESFVITGCYPDAAGKILNSNLKNTGVKQILIGDSPTETPRIIEELANKDGDHNNHKFLFTCSDCGQKLPKVKLPNERWAKSFLNEENNFTVLPKICN